VMNSSMVFFSFTFVPLIVNYIIMNSLAAVGIAWGDSNLLRCYCRYLDFPLPLERIRTPHAHVGSGGAAPVTRTS
jgi:hypothetical protein